MAANATVLTVEQEVARAAERGSDFKECERGCPVMIVIPAGKFTMGSPENEPGPGGERRTATRGHGGGAIRRVEIRGASPRRDARASLTIGDVVECPSST
jgi:hypothetical protein